MKTPKGFLFSAEELAKQIDARQREFSRILGLLDGAPQAPANSQEYLFALENYIFLNQCIAEWAVIHKNWLERAKRISDGYRI
jgi:hypothetical protein